MGPLDKKTEQEVLKVFHAFSDAFFAGSLEKIWPLLHENIQIIGTTEAEVFSGKESAIEALSEIIKQTHGAIEPRNRKIDIKGAGNIAIVEEHGDLFVQLDGQWLFYSKGRSTFLLEHGPAGWLIVYQHASFPDSSAEGGETLGLERLQRENTELREAVRRRTRELELKNRELEIEAAVERVRVRALAMQRSSEIKEVAATMRNELLSLGIEGVSAATIWLEQPNGRIRAWDFTIVENTSLDKDVQVDVEFDPKDAPPRAHFHKVWNRQGNYWVGESDLDDLYESVKWLKTHDEEAAQDIIRLLDSGELKHWWHPTTVLAKGRLNVDFVVPPPEEMANILPKMAAAFDLAYRRFEDLQKAEAQAREAQIEAALERVRSRTMAMHKSEELIDVAAVVFQQLKELGIDNLGAAFNIADPDRPQTRMWMFLADQFQVKAVPVDCSDDRHLMEVYKAWKEGRPASIVTIEGKDLIKHQQNLEKQFRALGISELSDVAAAYERAGQVNLSKRTFHNLYFSKGWLLIVTEEPIQETGILLRFTEVFDQTYTRFLDLQKAEAQAREAQIEAALERVRAASMAMHRSEELPKVALTFLNQLELLAIPILGASINIINDENRSCVCYLADNSARNQIQQILSEAFFIDDFWVSKKTYALLLEGETEFTIEAEGEEVDLWIKWVKEVMSPERAIRLKQANLEKVYFPAIQFHDNSNINFSCLRPLSRENWALLRRMAGTFGMSYRRFLDLQKVEAFARETARQASIDRVRAEIASMRSAKDLERITPLIWQELIRLEVPFFRCGVFIINEDEQLCQVFLTTPEGESLAAMELPFGSSDLVDNTVRYWQNRQVYTREWNKAEFRRWTQSLTEQGYVSDPKAYQGNDDAPEHLALHFVPFKQGMLYVGSEEVLTEDQLSLVHALADAFSVAFARYEDFRQLESAKANLEQTLADLQATQSQLIQQEKLASLGQLTAGIAHEIKNPLNFVNNFSEVSMELLAEAMEEIQSLPPTSQKEELQTLLDDVQSNLRKIHHHGNRADGIVRSMLLHSRGGSGQPEPADLNVLLAEYANLAFHGMRAGKEPINVTIDLDLDEQVNHIPLVVEDFSRVILNLCTNAFDAMRSKLKADPGNGYHPRLGIRTRRTDHYISIEITDNGPGIPAEIRDRVLEPFFTTKKGTDGTGLGLSISNDIVKAHRGTLTIEEASGTGTIFIIKIPNE